MKIISIHQPEHLPWMGFFNKMAKADEFIFLDNVPFRKNYFQNRNRIIGTNRVQWIGVPVSTKDHMGKTIADTRVVKDGKWEKKYLRTITDAYGKYPFFDIVFSMMEPILLCGFDSIADLNIAIIRSFSDAFGIKCTCLRAKELKVNGHKSDLILDICKKCNADCYIAGPFGREYLEKERFDDEGIRVCFNDYCHPKYPQKRTEIFEGYLSALDLVMNVGFDKGFQVIMDGNEGLSDQW